MACPNCGGIERTTLPDGRYRCESPVQFNGPLLDVVPPNISGTTAGVPSYGEPRWRPCGHVYTRQESEAYGRHWEAKAAGDREEALALAAASAAVHPVERLLRFAGCYGVVRDGRMQGDRVLSARVDFGKNQIAFWTSAHAMDRNDRPEVCDESVAKWFAKAAISLGLDPDDSVYWPNENASRSPKRRRYSSPLRVHLDVMTDVWRIPASLMVGREPLLLEDGFIAADGRLDLPEGRPAQGLGDAALVFLAGRLGYPVTWKSRGIEAPIAPRRPIRATARRQKRS